MVSFMLESLCPPVKKTSVAIGQKPGRNVLAPVGNRNSVAKFLVCHAIAPALFHTDQNPNKAKVKCFFPTKSVSIKTNTGAVIQLHLHRRFGARSFDRPLDIRISVPFTSIFNLNSEFPL